MQVYHPWQWLTALFGVSGVAQGNVHIGVGNVQLSYVGNRPCEVGISCNHSCVAHFAVYAQLWHYVACVHFQPFERNVVDFHAAGEQREQRNVRVETFTLDIDSVTL